MNRDNLRPSRVRSGLIAVAASLFLFTLTGCHGFLTATYEPSLGPQTGEVTLPGMEKGATIKRDSMGIPLIEADTITDCVFANGYADASDRLAQMVGNSLTAQGRLSEMAGRETLEIDLFMRTLNLKERAQTALDNASPYLRQILSAYSRGVNAYLWTAKKLPPDLSLSGYKPDPWRPIDCLYVFYIMNLGLATNLGEEIAFLNVAQKIGPQKAAWLVPVYPDEPLRFSEAEKLAGLMGPGLAEAAEQAESMRRAITSIKSLGIAASNNWAVYKDRTASGASIVANDTHLNVSLPSLWKLVHIRCKGLYDAAGISAAGLPGVVAGYNGHLAWGMTMVMADNQDLFLEKLSVVDGKTCYLYKGQWVPAKERTEVFHVKGGKTVTRVIHETLHGPILNQALRGPSKMVLVPEQLTTSYAVALSWAQSPTDATFDGFFSLGRAKTMAEAKTAISNVSSMALNMVYGDRDNIAWQVTGIYPVRKKGQGLAPSPGWTGEYDWTGFVPNEALPYSINPDAGFLATANARAAEPGPGPLLSSSWFSPERVQRIGKVLAKDRAHTAEKSFDLQYDQVSNLIPKLQRVLFNSDQTDEIMREIGGWSNNQQKSRAREALAKFRVHTGDMGADEANAALFGAFYHCFTLNTFSDELGPADSAMWHSFLALGDASYSAQEDHLLVRGDESPFFDDIGTPEKETKAQVLAKSLAEAVEFLEQRLGADRNEWKWGRLHTYYFETEGSKMARNMDMGKRMGMRALSGYFNVGPFPAGGDCNTLNVSGYRVGLDFDTLYIPEMRMVVDFSRPEPLFIMNSTGQSGNPASPHYEDGVKAWRFRRYTNMPFDKKLQDAAYTSILRLVPKY
ncbi:MAG: penicillin acylase family protein [Deltaproteobacteria bacterium]|nr:penicillin acylase family protein [Deltaproteobacteria bacterium]